MSERVLITGVAGFFGSHLLEHIIRKTDWEIVGLDCINYAGNLCRFYNIDSFNSNKDRFKFVWHDLKSSINTSVANQIGDIDIVLKNSQNQFLLNNVLGTCHLLEYVKHNQPNLKKYIQFSTDEVFGAAPDGVFYGEWDRHKPSNPYAACKAGADDLSFSFAHSFGIPVVITHCMNLFGEGQDTEKFVPMTIRKILLGENVTIHGTPNKVSSRKWVHCRNAADAVLFLLDKGVKEEKYNIAGTEMDVLSIAKYIAGIIGKPLNVEYIDYHSYRPGHDLRYSLDGSKLSNLGWNPPVPFLESLERTVTWSMERKSWINIKE